MLPHVDAFDTDIGAQTIQAKQEPGYPARLRLTGKEGFVCHAHV